MSHTMLVLFFYEYAYFIIWIFGLGNKEEENKTFEVTLWVLFLALIDPNRLKRFVVLFRD